MKLIPILIDEMDINNFNGGSVSGGVWSGYRAPGGTATYSYNSIWSYKQNRDYVIEVKFNTNDTSYFSTLDLGVFIIHWHRDTADYVGVLDGGSYKTFTADTKGDKTYKLILKRDKSYEIYINDVLFQSGSVTNLPANGNKSIACLINSGYARIDYIRINEIKNDKYLFQDGTEIKKYESGSGWVSVGTAPATKAMFDQYGMTDLSIIDNNAIQQLTSDTPELLCWTDEEETINYTNDLCVNGTPIASSSYDSSSTPDKAFNNNTGDKWESGETGTSAVGVSYIGYDFGAGNEKHIRQIKIYAGGGLGLATSVIIQRWDSSLSQWSNVYTASGIVGESWNTINLPSSAPSQKWRLLCNEAPDNGFGWIIREIEMMEIASINNPVRQTNITAVPFPQLLLPVGDVEVGEIESVNINSVVIGGIHDTNNIAPYLTSYDNNVIYGSSANVYYMFDRNINSKITYSSAAGLKVNIKLSQPEIIRKIAIIAGTGTSNAPKAFKVYGSNAPTDFSDVNNQNGWTLLADITSQTGWTINERREFVLNNTNAYQYVRFEFYQSNNFTSYEIAEIELFPASEGNSDLKILVSGDSGASWKGKNGVVDISDLTQVKVNGFTIDELNALTKQELASLFPNGKARFAFYLEQEKSTDIVQIDSLKINEKVYTMTPSIESLKVIYNLLEAEKPKIYVSRDDGVTWKEVQPDTLTSLEELPEGNKLRVKVVLSNGQELHALSYSWI